MVFQNPNQAHKDLHTFNPISVVSALLYQNSIVEYLKHLSVTVLGWVNLRKALNNHSQAQSLHRHA